MFKIFSILLNEEWDEVYGLYKDKVYELYKNEVYEDKLYGLYNEVYTYGLYKNKV